MHASVLKYFVEVARCGSVRKASGRLFVAASAVNRQIIKLEEEVGVELFDRLPNGMRLNPAGERLLKHVQKTLHEFQVLRSELDAMKGERTGHIKISSMDSFLIEFLPTCVEEFVEIFPAVKFTISAAPPLDIPAMILSGNADIGMTFIGRLPAGVIAVAMARLPLGIVMAPGHPLANHAQVSLQDCALYPFLRSNFHPAISSSVCPEFTRFWDALEPADTCNYTPMLKRLIIAGRGISCFSKIGFIDELRRGDVVWRPFELEALNELQVGIVVPQHRALPHLTQNFVARLEKSLAQLEALANALHD